MKRWIEAMMKRTVLLVTSLVIILAWGGFAAYDMQRDYMPPINNPALMVTLHAPNLQAEQIKAYAAEPIVRSVRGVDGLQSVETSSLKDGLFMSLYFPMNYDMKRAENDVKSVLRGIALPAGMSEPVVSRVSTSSFPIMRLSVSSAADAVEEARLRTSIQEQLVRELQSLPGVSEVRTTGGGSSGYAVTVRLADLRKAGLTIDDVKRSLKDDGAGELQGSIAASEVTIPLSVTDGSTIGQRLMQLPVRRADGQQVPLSSVADIKSTIVDQMTLSRTDGKASVVLDVLKTPSAAITDVSESIHARLRQIPAVQNGEIGVSVLLDQGTQVKNALFGLLKEGLLGCILSMACVFFFFRNVRSTMLIALSLPICFLATTGLLHAMGISLNILTVSGLIVAMGRVIDDSIVILDNIYRKKEKHPGRMNTVQISAAVREVLPAIAASTAAAAAVYVPISLVGGMIGSAFSGFAWSVVIALVTSLLVAMFVIPPLYHMWQMGKAGRSEVAVEPFSRSVLQWSLRRPVRILSAAALLLIAAAVGAAMIPVNFLPADKSGQLSVQLEFPEGTSLPQMDATAKRMEQRLQEHAGVAAYSVVLGSSFTPQFDDVFDAGGGWIQPQTIANIAVTVKKGADADTVAAELQQQLSALSGRAVCTVTNQNISGDDSQLKISLTGGDTATLNAAAAAVRNQLQSVRGLSIAGSADDNEGIPVHRLTLNNEAIQKAGIEPGEVLDRIGAYLAEGNRIDRNLGDSSPVKVLLRTDTLQNAGQSSAVMTDPATDILTMLGGETFESKSGNPVKLNELAALKPVMAGSVIRERDGQPFALVQANITTRDVEKVAGDVRRVVDDVKLPAGVRYSINGISEQVNRMIVEMGLAIAVTALLILFILSMTFRNWRAPLLVLLCIPLAFIGSVGGMAATGGEWNLASLVGLLMLSGIIVTNGIVLLDKIERNLSAGMQPDDAVIDGTVSRVRPVLMTAIATILTLLPLCVSAESGSVISQSLGIVVVCGMISSTAISLLIIPIVYNRLLLRRSVKIEARQAEAV